MGYDGCMTNSSVLQWDFLGLPNSTPSNVSNPIHLPSVQLDANKSVTSGGPYIPTSAVSYRLRFGPSSSSPSNVINNPVVAEQDICIKCCTLHQRTRN